MSLIILFEYAHITTLFRTRLDIGGLDQDVFKQDAVYIHKDISDQKDTEDTDAKTININQTELNVIDGETSRNNHSIVAKDIIK